MIRNFIYIVVLSLLGTLLLSCSNNESDHPSDSPQTTSTQGVNKGSHDEKEIISKDNTLKQYNFVIAAPHTSVYLPDLELILFSTNPQSVKSASKQAEQTYVSLIHKWFSWRSSQGLLAQTNRALSRGEVMLLLPEDIQYLQQLKLLGLQSHQHFDPMIGQMQQLWGFTQYPHGTLSRSPPLTKRLNATIRNKANVNDLNFTEQGIYGKNKQIQLTLYTTFKGYLIERLFDLLMDFPTIQWANIRIGNTQKIVNTQRQFVFPITTEELGLAGIEQNSIYLCHGDVISQLDKRAKVLTYQNKQYHHIINPKTARPIKTQLAHVTVYGNNAIVTEAASLAVFTADKQWQSILADMSIKYAFVIEDNRSHVITKALQNRLEHMQDQANCLMND